MQKGLLVKYGEIAIKGNNRYAFENVLIKNIKDALRYTGSFVITKEQGRLLIETSDPSLLDAAVEKLQKVFGIIGICPVSIFDDNSLESLKMETMRYLKEVYGEEPEATTFKVEARRADKRYPMTSIEIAALVGEQILDEYPNWTVDVRNPKTVVHVELRTRCYVFSKILPGPGGMPVMMENKVTLLLSGGIDSPVAGYMMAKRGAALNAVYFHAHPYTTDRAKDKVIELARRLSEYCGNLKLFIVPFTDIQLDIYDKCPHDQLTIIMRRVMSRIAQKIAFKTDALALVTGENMGQVASQTLQSLYCTNEVCEIPVFRPLIGFDKQEIIDIAQKIDTYETSILPYEDCCTIFVAKHPQTKPKLEEIKESEKLLTDIDEAILKAVRESEIVILHNGKRRDKGAEEHGDE